MKMTVCFCELVIILRKGICNYYYYYITNSQKQTLYNNIVKYKEIYYIRIIY